MEDLITKIEQMQAEARDGMKRASRDSDPYLYQYLVGKFHAFGKVAGILKKQKEQKPAEYLDKDKVYAIMKKLHDLAFSQRIPIDSDEYKKIGEITSDVRSLLDYPIEQKLILEVFGFKVGDAVRLKDGDGRKHIIKSFEEVEGLHGPNFYHVEFEDNSARSGIYTGEEYPNGYYTQMEKFEEEQKPAEYLDKDMVYSIMKKLHDLAFSQLIPIDSEEYKKIGEITSEVRSLLDYPIEQKPAEWSEDWREEDIQTRFAFYTYKDEDGVLYLSNVFVEEASRNHGFGTKILIAAEKVAEIIGATTISLKVKQDSPANAWYRKNGYGYVAFEDGYDWLEKNLEYMKPNKQEWSEEDEKMLEGTLMWLDDLEKQGEYVEKERLWLKSLRPVSKESLQSWKPTEEQPEVFDTMAFQKGVQEGRRLERDEHVTDCHDLEEAAENSWAVYEYCESPKGLYSTCYVDGFIAGAEWMKTKMIKEDAK